MEGVRSGCAIFSTHLGRFLPRLASTAPMILRSSPEDDQDEMVANLQQKFPLQCKAITAPITDIYQYFDHYDAHRHGYAFLTSVLVSIAYFNERRAERVQEFAQLWTKHNAALFDTILSRNQNIFTELEVTEHGDDFLSDVFIELQRLRMNMASQSKSWRSDL